MEQYPSIEQIQHLCIQAILRKQDPNTFIHAVYELLRIPTIVFDTTIALITYAFPRPFYFHDWEEIAEFGACPQQKVIDKLRDYQEVIYRNRGPTLITWGTCAEKAQSCCPILYQDFLYGYIGMAPEDDANIETIMEIEGIMANTLGYLLNFAAQEKNISSPEQYVSHLLLRDCPDAQVLMAYEAQFSPPYLLAMMVSPIVNEAELQFILGHLSRTQPGVIGCTFESRYLYLMISGMDSDKAMRMISRHLRSVALQPDYFVSLSDTFDDIRQLPEHKVQAIRALSVGRSVAPENHFFSFRDIYMDMICFNAVERFGPSAALPYVLRKLAAYDEQENKNYLETLSCYLHNLMNLSATAQAMKLHPNTVRVRLDKISAMLSLDLSDFSTIQQLRTGLHMYHFLENDVFQQKSIPGK